MLLLQCMETQIALRRRVLLEKQTVPQLFNKCTAFYGTQKFITAFKQPATYPYPEPD